MIPTPWARSSLFDAEPMLSKAILYSGNVNPPGGVGETVVGLMSVLATESSVHGWSIENLDENYRRTGAENGCSIPRTAVSYEGPREARGASCITSRPPHIQTSARVRGRGVLPSMSEKPYSTATLAATSTVPVCRMTSGSAASAATARPMNSGDSEFVRSSQGAASMTFSVLTNPGYKDTTVTPCGRNSTAISAVILSVAAFDTPYATFAMCF